MTWRDRLKSLAPFTYSTVESFIEEVVRERDKEWVSKVELMRREEIFKSNILTGNTLSRLLEEMKLSKEGQLDDLKDKV